MKIKVIFYYLLLLVFFNNCKSDNVNKTYYAELIGCEFYNININNLLNSNFLAVSRSLNSKVSTDKEGHIWINGKINSTEYNIVNNNYNSDKAIDQHFPEEVNFYNNIDDNPRDLIEKFLLSYSNIIIFRNNDFDKIINEIRNLDLNSNVIIDFKPKNINLKLSSSGIAIRKINKEGEFKYFVCLFFRK